MLPLAELAHNSQWHSSLRCSLFQAAFGYQPRVLPFQSSFGEIPAAANMVSRLTTHWRNIKKVLLQSVHGYKGYADCHRKPAPRYRLNQLVWLSTKNMKLQQPSSKLGPSFIGPFSILCQVNPVAYKLRLPLQLRIPNTFHVYLLKPFVKNRFSLPSRRPSPVPVDDHQEYELAKFWIPNCNGYHRLRNSHSIYPRQLIQ